MEFTQRSDLGWPDWTEAGQKKILKNLVLLVQLCAAYGTAVRLKKNTKTILTVGENVELWKTEYIFNTLFLYKNTTFMFLFNLYSKTPHPESAFLELRVGER